PQRDGATTKNQNPPRRHGDTEKNTEKPVPAGTGENRRSRKRFSRIVVHREEHRESQNLTAESQRTQSSQRNCLSKNLRRTGRIWSIVVQRSGHASGSRFAGLRPISRHRKGKTVTSVRRR